MDTKRKLRELAQLPHADHHPQPHLMPWPILQRRRIEKLKDDRLAEFERACDESFEWLENYYQGSSPGYHHSLPHQHQQQQQRHQQQQHHQQQQRQKTQYTPKSSPAKFRLKSPKTPSITRIGSPTSPYERQQHHHRHGHHIHTTPRKKLRVTAKPSTMKAQRALKAKRKRTASFQNSSSTRQRVSKIDQQQHQEQQKQQQQQQQQKQRQEQQQVHERERQRVSGTEESIRHGDRFVPLKQPQQPQEENSRHSTLDSTRKHSNNQDMVTQTGHTPTTPASDRSFTFEPEKSFSSEKSYTSQAEKSFTSDTGRSFIAELRASTFKTPAKGQSSRAVRSSYSQTMSTGDTEVDSDDDERGPTPGSKARDSMTLKSPVNRSDTSMDQDMDSPLRTSLMNSAARNRSSSSVAKRSSDLMETDQDRAVDAESKRSKSSPFTDVTVPIRFHSPETEPRATTKTDGSTRERRTNFNDPSTVIMTTSRSAERFFTDNGSRWREPEVDVLSTKNRGSDADDRPTRSTTPSTTPHQRYGYSSPFPERLDTSSEDAARGISSQDGVRDESFNAGPARGQVNGDPAERPPNGMSSSAEQRSSADTAARKQAKHSDPFNLPGSRQDDRSLRQTDRKEEANTLPLGRSGRPGTGDESEQSTRLKPTASRIDSSSSDTGALRLKLPSTTLPEKRTLGARKPTTTTSHTLTAAFMLPSRLTKLTSTDMTNGPGSAAESQSVPSTTQSDNSATFQSSSSNRMTRIGSSSSLKDSQQSGQVAGAGPNGFKTSTAPTNSSGSTSSLIGRQGAPSRQPLTSNRTAAEGSGVNSTSTGHSRSDGQGSHPPRKPFAIPTTTVTTTASTTKSSVFSVKKATSRPVLPDGVSSALLASSSSSSARPAGSSLAMMQARMDQHAREPTPTRDTHAKSGHSTSTTQRTESKSLANSSTSTLSLSSVISSRKESMTIAPNGARTETRVESKLTAANDGGHVFAVPGPMSNQAQTDHNHRHFKTILPEIKSDDEDDNDDSGAKRKKMPGWASWEELNRAMEEQRHLNPEEIFGPLPILDVGEIFPGRKKKPYRPRSSSAHWGASDALTPQEVFKYNEDMGWTDKE
ncbi:hypothetical protein KI688_002992 [Linnemannia hyalina]|uniref:Inner centromere protein ARK-binding domain-containing protein n=1 Tax=Linnemannia hyalina TaxID=64524 RepID=A0A9P8BR01_9FUNG|nr:hypothetical protein KI688_002992 [Linnemannia hyalina]